MKAKRKGLPKRSFELGGDLYIETDSIGHVNIHSWIVGTPRTEITNIHIFKLKKLRDWINKVIEYTERP